MLSEPHVQDALICGSGCPQPTRSNSVVACGHMYLDQGEELSVGTHRDNYLSFLGQTSYGVSSWLAARRGLVRCTPCAAVGLCWQHHEDLSVGAHRDNHLSFFSQASHKFVHASADLQVLQAWLCMSAALPSLQLQDSSIVLLARPSSPMSRASKRHGLPSLSYLLR